MQLVVARVAAVGAVANEASARTSLEAARQSAENRATTAETAAATAATERDLLASRLALAEAEIEKFRAAAASVEEAAERDRTTAGETATRDSAQAATREKATVEARVSELECDLGTTMSDLATTSRNSPRSPTNSRWPPRRQRGFVTPTPSCCKILMVLGGLLLSLSGFPLAPCRALICRPWL
jgi:hypothetical protein